MITRDLIDEYEAKVGEIAFTLSLIGPDRADQVADMMRQAIAGRRGPITDAELDQEAPPDAES